MLAHIVLFRPKPDLPADARRAFARAFERAVCEIPSVRRARVGRRCTLGTVYDSLMREDFSYAAIVEFDDEAGLKAYLEHPAHQELGERFYQAIEIALTYDFEMRAGEEAGTLLGEA